MSMTITHNGQPVEVFAREAAGYIDMIVRADTKAAKVFQIVSIGIQGGVVAANMRFVF